MLRAIAGVGPVRQACRARPQIVAQGQWCFEVPTWLRGDPGCCLNGRVRLGIYSAVDSNCAPRYHVEQTSGQVYAGRVLCRLVLHYSSVAQPHAPHQYP